MRGYDEDKVAERIDAMAGGLRGVLKRRSRLSPLGKRELIVVEHSLLTDSCYVSR
jgi:hypothetical protein